MDMTGRRVIVTGPTSGLGREIALELAARGAELVLACRDTVRGDEVSRDIVRRGGAQPAVLQLDASSQASIRGFARGVRERFPRIDVLVDNAGAVQQERLESVDGVELTFATNVLGYHLVTRELLPILRASAPARVVVVASTFASDLDLDDLQFNRRPYDGLRAYAQSKACNRLFTWALARRLGGSGVVANAMAPGFVPGTDLSRNLAPDLRQSYKTRPGRSIAQGADTAVWLAASAEVEKLSGGFYFDREQLPCQFRSETDEERLWAACERLASSPSPSHL